MYVTGGVVVVPVLLFMTRHAMDALVLLVEGPARVRLHRDGDDVELAWRDQDQAVLGQVEVVAPVDALRDERQVPGDARHRDRLRVNVLQGVPVLALPDDGRRREIGDLADAREPAHPARRSVPRLPAGVDGHPVVPVQEVPVVIRRVLHVPAGAAHLRLLVGDKRDEVPPGQRREHAAGCAGAAEFMAAAWPPGGVTLLGAHWSTLMNSWQGSASHQLPLRRGDIQVAADRTCTVPFVSCSSQGNAGAGAGHRAERGRAPATGTAGPVARPGHRHVLRRGADQPERPPRRPGTGRASRSHHWRRAVLGAVHRQRRRVRLRDRRCANAAQDDEIAPAPGERPAHAAEVQGHVL